MLTVKQQKKISELINTSVDDAKISIDSTTDSVVLNKLVKFCETCGGKKTLLTIAKRRIKKLNLK